MLEHEFQDRPELVRKRAHVIIADRLWRWFWMFMIIVVIAINTFTAVTGLRAREELLDCTRPSGKCYKQGQARTADVVAELARRGELRESKTRRIVVLAAACARTNVTVSAIADCVNTSLKGGE